MDATGLPNWHETFSASVDAVTSTIHVCGTLEIFTVEYLRGAVEIARLAGNDQITINMSALRGIDPTGIASLLELTSDLQRGGVELRLSDPWPNVRAALKLGGLTAT